MPQKFGLYEDLSVQEASASPGAAKAVPHIWYNSELESRYFLVPGVTALILTIIGSLLTSLVFAREWDRGTWESLAATAASPLEILLGKTIPCFMLGMLGFALCLCSAVWIFMVPVRGPVALLVLCSAVYIVDALGMGLLISAKTKSQILASQIVLVATFLPTLMLSGFIFDLRNLPVGISYFSRCFPATWYVELLQTLFLVGNVPGIVFRNSAVLWGFSAVFFALACKQLRKSLE